MGRVCSVGVDVLDCIDCFNHCLDEAASAGHAAHLDSVPHGMEQAGLSCRVHECERSMLVQAIRKRVGLDTILNYEKTTRQMLWGWSQEWFHAMMTEECAEGSKSASSDTAGLCSDIPESTLAFIKGCIANNRFTLLPNFLDAPMSAHFGRPKVQFVKRGCLPIPRPGSKTIILDNWPRFQ